MPADLAEFDEAYGRILSWGRNLVRTAESSLPEIRETLANPAAQLPEGCTSRASLAELAFRQVKGKLEEVQGAIQDAQNAIWKAGS